MINEWPNNEELNELNEEYEEDDDEIIQNEESPIDIDENFKNNVVNIKHELYENTVLSPELNTDEKVELQKIVQHSATQFLDYFSVVKSYWATIYESIDMTIKRNRKY